MGLLIEHNWKNEKLLWKTQLYNQLLDKVHRKPFRWDQYYTGSTYQSECESVHKLSLFWVVTFTSPVHPKQAWALYTLELPRYTSSSPLLFVFLHCLHSIFLILPPLPPPPPFLPLSSSCFLLFLLLPPSSFPLPLPLLLLLPIWVTGRY